MPARRRTVDYRIDPFDLQLFIAIVERGSITAAAETMHLSLAAASARVKALEHRVGSRLLERSKAGATATDAGRALLRQAHRVLGELETLHIEMASFGRGLRGSVRLLGNTSAISEALPPRLGRFLIEHPDVDVVLQELPSDAVLDALRRDTADVGILSDHVDTSGLITHPWISDALVALLPRSFRGRAPLSFAQLLEQPFVGLSAERGLSRLLAQQAARSGRVPHHRVRVSSFDAVVRLVEAGVGVAVMPLSAAQRWRTALSRTVALRDDWAQRRLLICTTAHAQRQQGPELLIRALLEG